MKGKESSKRLSVMLKFQQVVEKLELSIKFCDSEVQCSFFLTPECYLHNVLTGWYNFP